MTLKFKYGFGRAKKITFAPWKKNYDKLSLWKSKYVTLPTKVHIVKAMIFSSSHVWVWELDHEEGWVTKNWCLQTLVLEKTLESPLDCKEIQPVHPKGNQPWIFIGRTDAEADAPSLMQRSDSLEEDPDAGKDWGQEEKGTTEGEMVGWHQQLDGHECEQTLGVVMDREAWRAAVHGITERHDWVTEQQEQK